MEDHLIGDLNQRSKSLKHTAAASSRLFKFSLKVCFEKPSKYLCL